MIILSLNAAFSLLIWYIWKRTYYGNPIRFIERSKLNTWHFVNEIQNTIQTYQNDMEVTRNERGTGVDPVLNQRNPLLQDRKRRGAGGNPALSGKSPADAGKDGGAV